jgi:hypothetical protein
VQQTASPKTAVPGVQSSDFSGSGPSVFPSVFSPTPFPPFIRHFDGGSGSLKTVAFGPKFGLFRTWDRRPSRLFHAC